MMGFSPHGLMSSLLSNAGNAVRNVIFSRLGVTALGVLLVLLLIWFAGPLVGLKSASARWIAIGVVLGVVLLAWLVKWLIDRRRGRQLQKDLEESAMLGTRPDRETEIAALRKQMHEAVAALKSSELGATKQGAAALYALPWYMVIGPSAVGKSTILRNSDLHFPYSKHDPRGIQGVGGTRNCDWWLSSEAIFLDTAGRYTTEEDDREEWFAFLDMVRKNRPKQPINGVLVAMSIADILTCDPDAVSAHAKVVRERIDELIDRLGIVFPVYLIFTKSDLIKGFTTFFEDLSDTERGQVWGASMLALDNGKARDVGEVFESEFNALYARLCAHRITKLQLQRNVARKIDIVDLPNQLHAAGARLSEFVQQVFKENPYQETPIFSGFFFTSGAQEGTPIQRVVGSLMNVFGAVSEPAENAATTQKPYFIHHLLKDVVLPNSCQVMRNRRQQSQSRWLKRAAIVGALAVMALGVVVFSTSYARKVMLIGEVEENSQLLLQALQPRRPDPTAMIKATLAFYNNTGELWADELKRFSFYKPSGFEDPLSEDFLVAMENVFLMPVARLIEERLGNYVQYVQARNRGQDPDTVAAAEVGDPAAGVDLAATRRSRRTSEAYEALKLYLYLQNPAVVDAKVVHESFTLVWMSSLKRQGVRVEELDTARLSGMVRFYLEAMRNDGAAAPYARRWESDKSLIAAARHAIQQIPNAERVYADLRDAGSRKLDPIDLVALLDGSPRGALTTGYTIPGIYSRKGWEDFVWPYLERARDSTLRSDWVLGTKDDVEEVPAEESHAHLVRQIRQMYFTDYAAQWFTMLGSINARKFDSLHDASTELQSLTKDDGAMAILLKNLRKQT
jgi:type VI secretion system protein ImpL